MIKIVFCLRRRAELSREEFQRYWREHHAPLVRTHAATLGIRRYVQVHAIDDAISLSVAGARHSPEPFDGVAHHIAPARTTIFATAQDADAGLPLHIQRLQHGGIFSLGQLLRGDAIFSKSLPRREQLGWPQQTADVVGSIG